MNNAYSPFEPKIKNECILKAFRSIDANMLFFPQMLMGVWVAWIPANIIFHVGEECNSKHTYLKR